MRTLPLLIELSVNCDKIDIDNFSDKNVAITSDAFDYFSVIPKPKRHNIFFVISIKHLITKG